MRTLGVAAVIVIRALAVVVGLWQGLGLLPVFTYFSAPGAVPPGVWVAVAVKTVILLACIGVFIAFGKVRAKLAPSSERDLRAEVRAEKSVEEFRRKEREFEERVAAQNRADGPK